MQTNNKKFGFRTIIRGFLDAFNIEKGIVPTLIDLFIRPLEVIKCYIEGDKEKYFSPGRFFVTVTAFLSIITFLNGGFNEEKINKVMTRSYETGYETGYGIGEKRWSKTEKSNKSLDEVFSENEEVQLFSEKYTKVSVYVMRNQWLQFLLLIIPAAFSSWLIFYKSNYKLAVHFVIQVYCCCFVAFFTSGILGLFINPSDYMIYSVGNDKLIVKFEIYKWLSILIPIIYFMISFKQIFQLNWLRTIFKVTLHGILSCILVIIPVVIVIFIILSSSFKSF